MSIIVVAGRKGGCGKSTTANMLAGALLAAGKTVFLFDGDINEGTLSMMAENNAGGILAAVVRPLDIKDNNVVDIIQGASSFADYVIVDTPPQGGAELFRLIKHADLVIVPIGADTMELKSAEELLSVFDQDKKILIAPNRFENDKVSKVVRAHIEKLNFQHLPFAPKASLVKTLRDDGQMLIEAPYTLAGKRLKAVYAESATIVINELERVA